MSNKSIFSIINFESSPRRAVSRPDFSRAKTPRAQAQRTATQGKPQTTRRKTEFGAQRAYTVAGAPFERLMALLVAVSFAAFIGLFLVGTALEMIGAFIVPGLIVGLVAFVGYRVIDARAARPTTSAYAPNDPSLRIGAGR